MLKNTIIVLLAMTVVLPAVFAADQASKDTLYILDRNEHSLAKFSQAVQYIRGTHPRYSEDQVYDLILRAYYEIKKHNSRITVYDVTEGLKYYTVDNLGIDLKDLVVAYINAQLQK